LARDHRVDVVEQLVLGRVPVELRVELTGRRDHRAATDLIVEAEQRIGRSDAPTVNAN